MPWRTRKNHPDCPKSRPIAVVKEGSDSPVGCHSSESGAKKQMAALYANEDSAEAARLLDEAMADGDEG